MLFQNNFEYKLHNVIRDPNGCFPILGIKILNKRLTLTNRNVPSGGDNPEFFYHVFSQNGKIENEYVMAARGLELTTK